MDKAAISAVYVNYRRIATRKVMQIHFECPLEQWQEFYKVLGEPDIETSRWFAIARMDATEPAPTPEDNGSNLTANAAILLCSVSFQKFIQNYGPQALRPGYQSPDNQLKAILAIESKKELNTDPAAAQRWRDLRSEYKAWMQAA